MKSQQVRLVDVFALGPFMVVSGWMLARKEHPWMGAALALSGLATIGYNWRNYQLHGHEALGSSPAYDSAARPTTQRQANGGSADRSAAADEHL